MNFAVAISSTATSFADARVSRPRVFQASDLKTNFIAMSAVASFRAGDVAEHDSEPAVAELEEVVDVAADVDTVDGWYTRRSRFLEFGCKRGSDGASCRRPPSAAGKPPLSIARAWAAIEAPYPASPRSGRLGRRR
jgi:hypothetical protein